MRVAVLADIHGNLLALEAVLEDLRSQSPDLVVNLGDHVSGPLEASRTAAFLVAQSDWIHIRGNHDRQLVEQRPEQMGASDRAARSELSDTHIGWLSGLPSTARVEGGSLCHGTPADDLEYLLEEVAGPHHVRLATPDAIRARLGYVTGLVLCGHTHVPRFVQVDPETFVLNPGSVGLQAYSDEKPFPHAIEVGSPHARYAVLDRVGATWRATFRTMEYNWNAASRQALERDRPDWACALATGYALR